MVGSFGNSFDGETTVTPCCSVAVASIVAFVEVAWRGLVNIFLSTAAQLLFT